MLRECRMILPVTDNAGISTAAIHKDLQRKLATTFGGYTMTPVSGGWIDKGQLFSDTSIAYDVALDKERFPEFSRIAQAFATRAAQKSVYVRDGFGCVAILSLPEPGQWNA